MKFKILISLLLVVFISCGKSRVADLSDRVESFNESLRWSSLKAAASYMAEENKRTLTEQYGKEFQKSRIVEYSIVDIGTDKDKKTGTVLVEFSYYDVSTQDLRYRQEIQTWVYLNSTWVVKDSRFISKNEQ